MSTPTSIQPAPIKTALWWSMQIKDLKGSDIELMVHQIQSQSFAAGERKGRIAGLNWARDAISDHGNMASGQILNELVLLEREEKSQ